MVFEHLLLLVSGSGLKDSFKQMILSHIRFFARKKQKVEHLTNCTYTYELSKLSK